MAPREERPRQSFQEALHLTQLQQNPSGPRSNIHRFASRQPAWKLGTELPWETLSLPESSRILNLGRGAFGGVVYAQAPLAAARAVEQEDDDAADKGLLGIHASVFTNPGLPDRPFIFEVSKIHSSRSFATRLINVRQPTRPSSKPHGPFPLSDLQSPLGDICFTCITTFKRPFTTVADVHQPAPPQERYKKILESRRPTEWQPSPQVDAEIVSQLFPNAGHGAFPILDMYKVDMREYNADRPIYDRRELILYRLLKPLSEKDVNAHILCHAFEADRNGLLMLGNHLGYGFDLGQTASLSYSFYVHVNAADAVMKGDGWWIQEVRWPRYSAGRGMMESRLWSPDGQHVASGYQDGIVLPGRSKQAVKPRL